MNSLNVKNYFLPKQFLVCILFNCVAIAGFSQIKWEKGEFIVAGKIIKSDTTLSAKTLNIRLNPLLFFAENEAIILQPDGSFYFKTILSFPQDLLISYGQSTKIIAVPGDSVFVKIDASKIDSKKFSPNEFIAVTHSRYKNDQINVLAFQSAETLKYNWEEEQKATKNLAPDQYKTYIKKRERTEYTVLEKFNRQHSTSSLFRRWALDQIYYSALKDLLKYRWENPLANNIERKDLNLSAEYFSFLKKIQGFQSSIISGTYSEFAHELYMYLKSDVSGDSIRKFNQQKNIPAIIDLQMASLAGRSSGHTRQVVLAKYFYSILSAHQVSEYEYARSKNLLSDSILKQGIEEKYAATKFFLSNKNAGAGAYMSGIDISIVKPVLDTLINRFTGKVIYIDFWAPWCVPCMKEMPSSKELQEYYKNKDIAFVFLASRCSDDSWKATIANHVITGYHINLTNDQFTILSDQFKISGIPHYVLIDKKGMIINSNAPSPSNKNQLVAEIDNLLR